GRAQFLDRRRAVHRTITSVLYPANPAGTGSGSRQTWAMRCGNDKQQQQQQQQIKTKTMKSSIIVKKIGMLIALVFVMGAIAQSVLAQNLPQNLDNQNLVKFSGGI